MPNLAQMVDEFFIWHSHVTDGSTLLPWRSWDEHGDALAAIGDLSESEIRDFVLLLGDLAVQFARNCGELLGEDAVNIILRDSVSRGWDTRTARDHKGGVRATLSVVRSHGCRPGAADCDTDSGLDEEYWEDLLAREPEDMEYRVARGKRGTRRRLHIGMTDVSARAALQTASRGPPCRYDHGPAAKERAVAWIAPPARDPVLLRNRRTGGHGAPLPRPVLRDRQLVPPCA